MVHKQTKKEISVLSFKTWNPLPLQAPGGTTCVVPNSPHLTLLGLLMIIPDFMVDL